MQFAGQIVAELFIQSNQSEKKLFQDVSFLSKIAEPIQVIQLN